MELALTVCESHVCGCYCKPVCITLVPLVQSQSFKDFLKEVFQIVYYYKEPVPNQKMGNFGPFQI